MIEKLKKIFKKLRLEEGFRLYFIYNLKQFGKYFVMNWGVFRQLGLFFEMSLGLVGYDEVVLEC